LAWPSGDLTALAGRDRADCPSQIQTANGRRAQRAKELAWKTLESLTLGAADDGEKTGRKRRLIKGPEEFQEVRVDQPAAPSGKKPV